MEENKKNKISNVPNLRFSGFKNCLTTLRLDEVVSLHARIGWQGLRQSEFMDSGRFLLITGTDFNDGHVNYEKCKYVSKERYNQDKNIQIANGDLLITKDGTIGKMAFVENLFVPATLNAGIYRVRINDLEKFYPKYLFYYLASGKMLDYANKQSTGGTIKHLNQSQIVSFPLTFGDIEEQKKIGSFLDIVSERIETQNKIIEDLLSFRKGIIDMFFKKASNSTRLSEYLRERKAFSEKGEGYEHVTLSKEGICPKTDRYDRDFLVKSSDKNYKITKLNDICYNPANLKFGVICLNDYGNAIFSPTYVTFEVKNIDPYYLSLYLTSESFIKRILKYQQGTVYERMAVNPDDFCKGRIPNKDKTEINYLINVVSALDKKIQIEKNILEKCCAQKTYLLNNLFI